MCADFGNLKNEIEALENAGSDILHLDLMDGQFVPNYGMGLQDIEYICRNSNIPCDIHMMTEHPGEYIEKFALMNAKIIYIHPEADKHAPKTLQKIRDLGVCSGIAVNPGTAFSVVEPLLSMIDYLLVMTVNPGFAGQKYLSFVDNKIDQFIAAKKDYGYKIMIDGACSPTVIQRLSKKGVDGFVLGTSALFGKERPYADLMKELKEL